MQKFIKNLPKIAKSDSAVLVLGETGVGIAPDEVGHLFGLYRQRNNFV